MNAPLDVPDTDRAALRVELEGLAKSPFVNAANRGCIQNVWLANDGATLRNAPRGQIAALERSLVPIRKQVERKVRVAEEAGELDLAKDATSSGRATESTAPLVPAVEPKPSSEPTEPAVEPREAAASPESQAEAERLHKAGFKLCKLKPLRKAPEGENWNLNPVTEIEPNHTGYGLMLALNNRCSIDPDHADMARVAMSAWGFNLNDLMDAGVRTASTRPGSGGRSMFESAENLNWFVLNAGIDGKNVTILEFRAKSPNLQDVLPGVIYRTDDGTECTQRYVNGRTIDKAPELPPAFLAFWARLSADPIFRQQQQDIAHDALRAAGHTIDTRYDLSGGGLSFGLDKRLRALFNKTIDVGSILLAHGYTCKGGRYKAPNATGEAGIREIPRKDGLWQSDHGSDPMRGTFDAAQAAAVLCFDYDEKAFDAWCKSHHAGLKAVEANIDFGGGRRVAIADVVASIRKEARAVDETVAPPSNFTLEKFFANHTLTTTEAEKMLNITYPYPNLIPKGSINAYPSPPNGGKTAIFTHASCKMADAGMKVFYINADANPSQLKYQQTKADKHGFRILAPDAKDAGGVKGLMQTLVDLSKLDVRLDDTVLVFDTLKKFVDMLSKGEMKSFMGLLRKLAAKGGTVCLLSHTNKYPGTDGKLIYEGTGDLRADVDNLIYLYSSLAEPGVREVTTAPDKTRAMFAPISFRIRFGEFGVSVEELDIVLPCLTDELREVLNAVTMTIDRGERTQERVVIGVAEQLMLGMNKARDKVKLLCDLANSPIIRTSNANGNGFTISLRSTTEEPRKPPAEF
jgi:hypothetical protein